MQKLRQQAQINNVPIIKPNIEKAILRYISTHNPRFVVELGTAVGYSTLVIAKAIEHNSGTITTFEVSYPSYMDSLANFRKYDQINNITAYNLDPLKLDLNKLFPTKKIDFLFVDAAKKEYINFYKSFMPFLTDNSLVIFDNIFKFDNKVKPLYSFLEKNQINYEVFELDGDGIMVLK